jgi:alkyldihydroxyacetonephosphate synthase
LFAEAAPEVPQSISEVDRVMVARDLWPRHHLEVRAGGVGGEKPALVLWPRSTDEVARVVRTCAREGLPIVPYGAGSGVCGGILPNERSVVLDLKRMNRWRALDPERPTLDVEPGVLGMRLEEELQAKGFTVGHFPSSILCSTVGGWVAGRGAGQCSGRYGKIEDMVASLELVDGSGRGGEARAARHRARSHPARDGQRGRLRRHHQRRAAPAPRARRARLRGLLVRHRRGGLERHARALPGGAAPGRLAPLRSVRLVRRAAEEAWTARARARARAA